MIQCVDNDQVKHRARAMAVLRNCWATSSSCCFSIELLPRSVNIGEKQQVVSDAQAQVFGELQAGPQVPFTAALPHCWEPWEAGCTW